MHSATKKTWRRCRRLLCRDCFFIFNCLFVIQVCPQSVAIFQSGAYFQPVSYLEEGRLFLELEAKWYARMWRLLFPRQGDRILSGQFAPLHLLIDADFSILISIKDGDLFPFSFLRWTRGGNLSYSYCRLDLNWQTSHDMNSIDLQSWKIEFLFLAVNLLGKNRESLNDLHLNILQELLFLILFIEIYGWNLALRKMYELIRFCSSFGHKTGTNWAYFKGDILDLCSGPKSVCFHNKGLTYWGMRWTHETKLTNVSWITNVTINHFTGFLLVHVHFSKIWLSKYHLKKHYIIICMYICFCQSAAIALP